MYLKSKCFFIDFSMIFGTISTSSFVSFWAPKATKNRYEKGIKKSHSKILDFYIFPLNFIKTLYFTGHNGPRGPILLYFTKNSRVRKGRKIQANVAKTLEKQ